MKFQRNFKVEFVDKYFGGGKNFTTWGKILPVLNELVSWGTKICLFRDLFSQWEKIKFKFRKSFFKFLKK
jgi:hypothetical protein